MPHATSAGKPQSHGQWWSRTKTKTGATARLERYMSKPLDLGLSVSDALGLADV
jgi:hypothetical protein